MSWGILSPTPVFGSDLPCLVARGPAAEVSGRPDGAAQRQKRHGRAATYPVLEIIAKLATVLECEPAELLRISGRPNR